MRCDIHKALRVICNLENTLIIGILEGENIDCESEASFEVTRTIEKVTYKKHKNSRRLSSAISAVYSKESTTIQATETQLKTFNPRDDAKLDSVDIQNIIDEIDGNIKDVTGEAGKNKKKVESDQGNQKSGDVAEGDKMKDRAGSDVSQVEPVVDEKKKR